MTFGLVHTTIDRPFTTVAGGIAMAVLLSAALPMAAVAAPVDAAATCSGSSTEVAAVSPAARLRSLPITIAVIDKDAYPVRGSDGTYYVAYVLAVQNITPREVRLTGFEVVDAATGKTAGRAEVRGYGGQNVAEKVSLAALRGGAGADSYRKTIPPGQTGYIYVNAVFKDRKSIPCKLGHRVGTMLPDVPGRPRARAIAAPVSVSETDAVVLSPPLRGRRWINLDGCCKEIGPHRLTVLTPQGRPRVPQTFAIDFLLLDGRNRFFTGDLKKNENWPSFGAPVYASAPGRVVSVRRNMVDNVPGSFPSTTTLNNAGGNMVITRIGRGQFIAYSHLEQGSVTVRVGDIVRRGQKLGRLGNSGNSEAPHLHFQVMNRPSLIDADPLPFVFDTMRVQGQFGGTAEDLDEALFSPDGMRFSRKSTGWRTKQMPLTGDLLRFD